MMVLSILRLENTGLIWSHLENYSEDTTSFHRLQEFSETITSKVSYFNHIRDALLISILSIFMHDYIFHVIINRYYLRSQLFQRKIRAPPKLPLLVQPRPKEWKSLTYMGIIS